MSLWRFSLSIKHLLKSKVQVSYFNRYLFIGNNSHFLFRFCIIYNISMDDCTIWQMLKYFHLLLEQRLNFFRFQKARFLVLNSFITKRKHHKLKYDSYKYEVRHYMRKSFVNLYRGRNAKDRKSLSHQNPMNVKNI